MAHVVSPVQRMPHANAWSWGFRPGFPGPKPAADPQLWERCAEAPLRRTSTYDGGPPAQRLRELQASSGATQRCAPRNNSCEAALEPRACALARRLPLLHCVTEERRFPWLLNQTSSLSTGSDKTRQKEHCWGPTQTVGNKRKCWYICRQILVYLYTVDPKWSKLIVCVR